MTGKQLQGIICWKKRPLFQNSPLFQKRACLILRIDVKDLSEIIVERESDGAIGFFSLLVFFEANCPIWMFLPKFWIKIHYF